MSGARIEEKRIARDIETIAGFSETDTAGRLRPPDLLPVVAPGTRLRDRGGEEGRLHLLDRRRGQHARAARPPPRRGKGMAVRVPHRLGSHGGQVRRRGGCRRRAGGAASGTRCRRGADHLRRGRGNHLRSRHGGKPRLGRHPRSGKLRLLRNSQGKDYLSAGAGHGVAAERLAADACGRRGTSGSSRRTWSRARACGARESPWRW